MTRRYPSYALAALAATVILLAGCAGRAPRLIEPPAPGMEEAAGHGIALIGKLRALCGKAYAGRIVANTPAAADDPFVGKAMVMHVRGCEPGEIRIAFQVGDDRSRTWVFQRTPDGVRFKHDHRHRDGSKDELTWYGGDLRTAPRPNRYEFPADAESQAMFRAQGREVSVPNVWAVEVDAQRYIYELARPGRLFRVEFDLSQPVTPPPPPWGG